MLAARQPILDRVGNFQKKDEVDCIKMIIYTVL
jgi:hypothetical protein